MLPRAPRGDSWTGILARYDSAQTTDENVRHWSWADSLSADSANSPDVRRVLRNRSRYEAANNSYCRSIVEALANDVIGTGPRVQVVTGAGKDADARINRELEFWVRAAKIAKALRTARKAKVVDGEGILVMVTKPRLSTPVKLGVRAIEAEQLATPAAPMLQQNAVDGIRFDEHGDPMEYDVLRYHPGDSLGWASAIGDADTFAATDVIHVFREDRPGQHRGIPELMPALPLFAQLRRFTLAVLAAAETAANYAAVIHTNNPPGGGYDAADGENVAPEAMDVFELAQRMVTVLPEGYSIDQIKAEQPTTTYGEFKREILAEAFAAVVMPYAVGANDSKDYNFASGKLDRKGYSRAVQCERVIEWTPEVYRLVFSWYLEARLIAGYLPANLPPFSQWTVEVYWDEVSDDLDPQAAANAQSTKLEMHTTTLAREYAKAGLNWEPELRQRAREIKLMEELGLLRDLRPESTGNASPTDPQSQPKESADDGEDEEE
jgi:capsid protein